MIYFVFFYSIQCLTCLHSTVVAFLVARTPPPRTPRIPRQVWSVDWPWNHAWDSHDAWNFGEKKEEEKISPFLIFYVEYCN